MPSRFGLFAKAEGLHIERVTRNFSHLVESIYKLPLKWFGVRVERTRQFDELPLRLNGALEHRLNRGLYIEIAPQRFKGFWIDRD